MVLSAGKTIIGTLLQVVFFSTAAIIAAKAGIHDKREKMIRSIITSLLEMAHTAASNGYAMWRQSVFHHLKFNTKIE